MVIDSIGVIVLLIALEVHLVPLELIFHATKHSHADINSIIVVCHFSGKLGGSSIVIYSYRLFVEGRRVSD